MYPFYEGISTRNYTKRDLDQLNAKDIEYHGKMYSEYEISQMLRQKERQARALKREKVALQTAIDEGQEYLNSDLKAINKKIRAKSQEIEQFCNETGYKRDRFREQVSNQTTVGHGSGNTSKSNINQSRAGRNKGKDLFDINQNYVGDTISYKNLFNALNKNDIGKETLSYIREHNIKAVITYDNPEDENLMGMCFKNKLEIYAINTKSVLNTARAIVHEVTHMKYNIGGNQWAEAHCRARELLFIKGYLTIQDKRDIIKDIRSNYPHYKWRRKS